MKKLCTLLAACVLLLSVFSGTAGAKHKAVEKFEEMHQYKGAELLGAAGRAAYSLQGEDRDVFVLLLEEELKSNWPVVNQIFSSQDTQEVMRAAFGDKFAVDKMDQIADYTVRAALREVLDSGYVIEQKNGSFYCRLDYGYLYDTYAQETAAEIGDYFLLRREHAQLMPQQWSARGDFIVLAEKYLKRYPDAFRKPEVNKLYRDDLFSYFLMLEAPDDAFAVKTDEKHRSGLFLDDHVLASYRQLAREFSATRAGRFAGRILGDWEKQQYLFSPVMKKTLSDYGRQIDHETLQRLEGIYTNNFDAGVFKPAGSKRYFVVRGDQGLLAKEDAEITGGKNGYIIAEVLGVTAKNLPVSLKEASYQHAVVVDKVVAARDWALDDKFFPADFLSLGVEPFWRLRILTDDEVIFEQAGVEQPEVFPYRAPVKGKCTEHKEKCWHYRLYKGFAGQRQDFEVVIVKKKAHDTMSDIEYRYASKIITDGRVYEGVAFRPGERPVGPDKKN